MLWGGMPAEYTPGSVLGRRLARHCFALPEQPAGPEPAARPAGKGDRLPRHRAARLKVFVSATHVRTGKAVVFTGASSTPAPCWPPPACRMLFQAVEIGGQAYWDGGYSLNPPLSPLISQCRTADLMLVQINPLVVDDTPHSSAEIRDRINELTFNASLLTQMRAIDFINRLLADGAISHERRLQERAGAPHRRRRRTGSVPEFQPQLRRRRHDRQAVQGRQRGGKMQWLHSATTTHRPARHRRHPARLPGRHRHGTAAAAASHPPPRPASGPGWLGCCASRAT
jgi:hypothetical protein